MSKITLDVDKKNIDTVLNILENLKSGLINNITTDGRKGVKRALEKPVSSSFSGKPSTSKYLSKEGYRNKMKKL